MSKSDLMFPFAYWVSRKDADGLTYSMSCPMWFAFVINILLLLNALLWGCIGVYQAVAFVV